MSVLDVSNLHKRYGSIAAVDDVSFRIEAGEIYGLLGPNGAGKTTTINIISTLLPADSGTVHIDIGDGRAADDPRRRIGYVPQNVSLADRLTGRENLAFFGRLFDLSGDNLAGRVERALEQVGLSDQGNKWVSKYSGGMQRRLNIAAALVHDPALLLMDEPTAGVDPQSRAYIYEIVRKLAANGTAVLYTTHYMEEAQRLCNRIGILDHGKLLAEGTLDELVERGSAKRRLELSADRIDADRAGRLARELGDAPFEINDGRAIFSVSQNGHSLVDIIRAADRVGLNPQSIALHDPDLETVFLDLTGRALRDA